MTKEVAVCIFKPMDLKKSSACPKKGQRLMRTTNTSSIWPEIPEDALLTRQQVVAILHIGMSTLDSLIPDSELPRVRLSKRVFVLKKDLEAYILAHRSTGGAKIPVGGVA